MDIFLYGFFQYALFGGMLIGLAAPMIGMFLVLRRMSMIGDTISHVSIAGVALGFLIGTQYPIMVGLLFAVIASFAIEWLRRSYKTYAELSIAIMLSGGIALTSFLFTLGRSFDKNVTSYLFGSIYTLDRLDLTLIVVITAVVVAAVLINYKELFLMTFDEDAAAVNGLPSRFYNVMITVLTALVISVAIKVVGALLVSALLTIPVACSLLVARSFKRAMWLSVLFSEIAVAVGLSVAGVASWAPGGTVVLLLIAMLIIVMVTKRRVRM
ncbi:metal ABC transporter permease [Paenibacillus turpanensis]|uniref:metal ABC transporter permease n=1 Tax=Paenibacillus turpanensis TaxID=2689078 RepID=UPI00140B6831|nr:metal ABC transporter permease [Paenibacillus turpanensis]